MAKNSENGGNGCALLFLLVLGLGVWWLVTRDSAPQKRHVSRAPEWCTSDRENQVKAAINAEMQRGNVAVKEEGGRMVVYVKPLFWASLGADKAGLFRIVSCALAGPGKVLRYDVRDTLSGKLLGTSSQTGVKLAD